ncbi:transposase [Duganella phyllosphaerae]|uniref:Insertion element IS402-like domain-containing protein n=1 Tax=Duganella phyllosphaerae TaxID=762836 RepID=A0A1E7WUS8_9BURK|nr:transposase [Duganella phyllosphaerae]OFA03453.1 hypothetical protein DUPY_18350 [Duganella phyllosphaerae]
MNKAGSTQAAIDRSGATAFRELNDEEWRLVSALHHAGDGGAPQRGRPRAAPRAMVNAALWILWSGAGWLTLPPHYPSPSTCRRHFERWLADGTWHAMTQRLAAGGRVMDCTKAVAASDQSDGVAPLRATFYSALMG